MNEEKLKQFLKKHLSPNEDMARYQFEKELDEIFA